MTTATEWSENSTGNPILEAAARAFARARLVRLNLGKPTDKLSSALADIVNRAEVKRDFNPSSNFSQANLITADHWLTKMPRSVQNYFAVSLSDCERTRFLTVFHSIGFCYWSDGARYTQREIEDNGTHGEEQVGTIYNGTAALLLALSRTPQILDADILSAMTTEKLEGFLGPGLLLMEERAAFLKELGQLLKKNPLYIEQSLALEDALAIAFQLGQLPGFSDQAKYRGETIYFLKRAQLLTADLLTLTNTSRDSGRLTASADYKLPQLLRAAGILEYNQALARLIDDGIELVCGGPEEVEIRLATILAVEAIKNLTNGKIKEGHAQLNAQQVDGLLWILAQSNSPAPNMDMRPYHRCRTTAY